MSLFAIIALGFLLGVRHATDADHVVAVTTLAMHEKSPRRAAWIGAIWGLGHSLTVLLFGGAMILFGWVIPHRWGLSLEFAVAMMLIVLGVRNLIHFRSPKGRSPERRPHAGSDEHHHFALRPMGIGILHGLAGSAAVSLMALSAIRNPAEGAVYLGVFGLGTVLGMSLLTAVMAVPTAMFATRLRSFERSVLLATGLVSVATGLSMGWKLGFEEGLFDGDAASMTEANPSTIRG